MTRGREAGVQKWSYLAHSTLRMRWSYPKPDTPAMARAASSRRWKLMKAKPWGGGRGGQSQGHNQARRPLPQPPQPPAHLGLASGLVLRQVDARYGAKGPEEFLQVSLASVLGQVGDTDGGVVVSWTGKERQLVREQPSPGPGQRIVTGGTGGALLPAHLCGWAA